jgi:hypothetical protein
LEIQLEEGLRKLADLYARTVGSPVAADFFYSIADHTKKKGYQSDHIPFGLLPFGSQRLKRGRGRPKGTFSTHDSGAMALRLFHLHQDGHSVEKLAAAYRDVWIEKEGRHPDATPEETARTSVRRLIKRGERMQAAADRLAMEIDLSLEGSAEPGEAVKNALLKRNN